jgi:hypothetical protein
MASCGTGIEVTEHVTDKDVRKVIGQVDSRQSVVTLEAFTDSLPSWKIGKRFWVADNQVKLLFTPDQGFDLDTVSLAGRVLKYNGYSTGDIYDNRQTVNILFNDAINGRTYLYRTGKTIDELHPAFSIPMLIDMDMVQHIERQIKGKDFYIRTPIWYDRDNEQMMTGRHFIQVCIDSVLPGNSVMPLRVLFTTIDKGEKAMVWMSDNVSVMHGRDFDAMFVASNPRLSYPTITDANWELITRGRVVVGMTKEECRLSLGTPRHINERPDQAGMREYWYYDGGSYLFFVDGLLSEFRR